MTGTFCRLSSLTALYVEMVVVAKFGQRDMMEGQRQRLPIVLLVFEPLPLSSVFEPTYLAQPDMIIS